MQLQLLLLLLLLVFLPLCFPTAGDFFSRSFLLAGSLGWD